MRNILILASNVGIAIGGYGGAERSMRLAESMPDHKVTIMMSSLSGDNQSKKINDNLEMLHIQEDRSIANQVFTFAKRDLDGNMDVAYYALFNKMVKFRTELKKQLQSADLVILDHVGSLGLIKDIQINVPVLYASHNCETDLANQMYPNNNKVRTYIAKMEKEIIERSSAITYCSLEDIKKMNELYNISVPTYYIPNGTDKKEIIHKGNETSKDLIFIGSGHGPNVDAAKTLIDTARLLPDYNFNIIGKCADSIKEPVPDNYIIHGHISNRLMDLLFETSYAFLNPMTSGSGTHLKIMRALSYGIPIVSSTVGLRGFSEEEIKDTLLVANNDAEISEQLAKLKDPKLYKEISERVYNLCTPYLWTTIQEQFASVVDTMLEPAEVVEEDPAPEQAKNVLIYSIIRNNEGTIDRYYDQIRNVVESITDHNFYISIYENDSNDKTVSKLMSKDWSFAAGISIISEKIGTTHFGSVKAAERVENLSKARNKGIEGGGFLANCDYVLMTEGDNRYGVEDVRKLLSFGEKEPDFDIVSAVSIRENGTHYDWWATRSSPDYKQGASEVPRNFKNLEYGEFYSTSNGLCLYKADAFKKGARHGWINEKTNKFDCEMVVLCQEFRKLGHNKIFVNYQSRSYH